MNIRLLISLAVVSLVACKGPEPVPDAKPKTEKIVESQPVVHTTPRRIILFLGDGMGSGAVTAAAYANGGPLEMMSMPHVSWMRNHEYEFVTTDSAASATAFATGHKTHYEGISVKPGTTAETETDPANHLNSVLSVAEEKGWKTGLVATSRINHATPAAFVAHRHYRRQYDDIALDASKSGVDVLLGAGTKFFEEREDGQNLMEVFEANGYTVARTREGVQSASGSAEKLIGLMHEKDMPQVVDGGRAMTLAEMTQEAIEVLDRNNDKGWFLMVEGSQIDWCEHDLAAGCTVAETLDFDAAVGVGLDYARKRNDTMIIATADHETGGLSVIDPRYVDRFSEPFGGESKASAAAAPAVPMEVERLPGHFTVGSSSWKLALEPVTAPEPRVWGLDALSDWRYSISFGHLSLESRRLLAEGEQDSFYAAHTTTHVPLFVEGPAAAYIAEVRDNAALGERLKELVGNAAVTSAPPQPTTSPKNIVVMIGDGMGINPITAAYYANGGLFMTGAPIAGIASTHAADVVVNDSAASATAIATGKRSRKGSVGMVHSPGGLVSAATLLEGFEAAGKKTGVVSTTPLTHATPAAFYAHVEKRNQAPEIAEQFVNLAQRIEGSDGVDVAVAGGLDEFDETRRKALADAGYDVRTTWSAEPSDGRVVQLLAQQGLPSARIRHRDGDSTTPTLAEMTTFAVKSLEKQSNDEGFFLMVEGGQIDWRLHELTNDATLVDEVVDFDEAVEAVVEWANKRGDTLVIVTADHDHTLSVVDNHYAFSEPQNCRAAKACGGDNAYAGIDITPEGIERGEGLTDATLQKTFTPPQIILQYDWLVYEANQMKRIPGPHAANFVPIFAWGPGSATFGGYVDQPEIGERLWKLSGVASE